MYSVGAVLAVRVNLNQKVDSNRYEGEAFKAYAENIVEEVLEHQEDPDASEEYRALYVLAHSEVSDILRKYITSTLREWGRTLPVRSIVFNGQRELDGERSHHSSPSMCLLLTSNDHLPFHFAWFPQGQLRKLIRMLIQTRIAYSQGASYTLHASCERKTAPLSLTRISGTPKRRMAG
jgi:hypothetical protein